MSDVRIDAPDPGARAVDPAPYAPTPERERALAALGASLEAGEIPCLEGPTGSGKTVLLQVLARRLSHRFAVQYLPFPMLSCEELCALALGLLGHTVSPTPEEALLRLAAECAARGRPLLLLIDDAASLPADSARGLAALRARSHGALHLALAGIEGAGLREVAAGLGATLRRVELRERLATSTPPRVAAHEAPARGSPSLHDVLGDDLLDELGRAAAANTRRVAPEAETAVPPVEPAPAQPTAAAAPERPAAPARSPAPADGTPSTGEYRLVRDRGETPPARSPREAEGRAGIPVSPSAPPMQMELPPAAPLPPAAEVARSERSASPAPRIPSTGREPRRAPSLAMMGAVAAVSAALGFGVATQLGRMPRAGGISPSAEPAPHATAAGQGAPSSSAPEGRVAGVPVPAEPAAPGAAAEEIEISINATPWASVEIDGRAVGETPLGGVRVSRGAHRFVARFPDGRVVDRTVEVDAAHRTLLFE